jgi:DNA-binding NtrC family response regulator
VAEAPSYEGTLKDIIERFERRVIEDVLGELDGHRTQTATRLGISRQALTQKLKKHGIT